MVALEVGLHQSLAPLAPQHRIITPFTFCEVRSSPYLYLKCLLPITHSGLHKTSGGDDPRSVEARNMVSGVSVLYTNPTVIALI